MRHYRLKPSHIYPEKQVFLRQFTRLSFQAHRLHCQSFMQVAIPIWDQRISPVLDAAGALWLTQIDDESHTIRWQTKVSLQATEPTARAQALANLGIDVLICGAVSQVLEQLLLSHGIHVIARKCGVATDVLNAYRQDQLDDITYALPGCQTQATRPSTVQQQPLVTVSPESSDNQAAYCDHVTIQLENIMDTPKGSHLIWSAKVGSVKACYLDLEHDQTMGHIIRFEIEPQWHNTPAPCRLLQEALNYCREQGLLKLTVGKVVTNQRALELFRCLGFELIRRGHEHSHTTEFFLNLYRKIDSQQCMLDQTTEHRSFPKGS
jgi:predicted Fe-Mo cluster-binding NifX family protein/N-acetylglutamate synthase-like GNAT family acetyltransferase